MNTHMFKRARRHFVHPMAPRNVQRANMRAWVAALRMLGDRWLLARPMDRRT
jgi:hypothetical protein